MGIRRRDRRGDRRRVLPVAGCTGEARRIDGHLRRIRAAARGCDPSAGGDVQAGVRGDHEVLGSEKGSATDRRQNVTRDGPMHDLDKSFTSALAGRYNIEGEIGRGAMATVYAADDLRHQRRVAMKVLRNDSTVAM